MGFPGGSDVKCLPATWETRVHSLGQTDPPWRRKWQPTPVLLPEKSYGWRSLVGYSPWGHKESDKTEKLQFRLFMLRLYTISINQWDIFWWLTWSSLKSVTTFSLLNYKLLLPIFLILCQAFYVTRWFSNLDMHQNSLLTFLHYY